MKIKFKILNPELFRKSIQCIGTDDHLKSLNIKVDDAFAAESWKERDMRNHKRFFSFMNTFIKLLPDGPKYVNLKKIEYLRKHLMIMIGECDIVNDENGKAQKQARSISFKNMDEVRFESIYKACRDAALKKYLPSITIEVFEKEIANYFK